METSYAKYHKASGAIPHHFQEAPQSIKTQCIQKLDHWAQGKKNAVGWPPNVRVRVSAQSYILSQASKEGLKEVLRASQRFNTKNNLDIKKIALYL